MGEKISSGDQTRSTRSVGQRLNPLSYRGSYDVKIGPNSTHKIICGNAFYVSTFEN